MTKILTNPKWAGAALVAALLALLGLVFQDLGGGIPELPAFHPRHSSAREVIPVGNLEKLFASAPFSEMLPLTSPTSLVYTAHFQPPPAVPQPDPPPAPTTQKVELLYHGFYTTGDGGKRAFIDVGGDLKVRTAGQELINEYYLGEITMRTVTLTNAAGGQLTLDFNSKKSLEVPLK